MSSGLQRIFRGRMADIGVVGAGTMGAGIVESVALAGGRR